MSLTPHLLQLPISQFKSLNLTSPFLHGASSLPHHLSDRTQSLRPNSSLHGASSLPQSSSTSHLPIQIPQSHLPLPPWRLLSTPSSLRPSICLSKMSLTPHLLQLPISQFKSLNLTSPFLHGASSLPHHLSDRTSSSPYPRAAAAFAPTIRAMRSMQGRVVCTANDKTVAVEVVRLVPHPKYKRRVRVKKKFQAHDPLNQFKVGDLVQLEKSRPISKTKAFVAIAAPSRNQPRRKEEDVSQELGLPLESEEILA